MERLTYVRYRIDGILRAMTPLHVGSGAERDAVIDDEKVKVSEVVKDSKSFPCLPASTLKGKLRSAADRFSNEKALTRELFGTGEKDQEVGARLLFQDALLDRDLSEIPPLFEMPLENGNFPLYWDASCFTYISTGTALNRVTRTVEKHKLFYHETVPSGAVFRVSIFGEGLTHEELAFLLKLLEGFKGEHGICLGGETAHGFGQMQWEHPEVSGVTSEDELREWLNGTATGFEGFPKISGERLKHIQDKISLSAPVSRDVLSLELKLCFDGPFMVNDPSQAYKADDGGLSHTYLRNEKNQIVLRSRSFHGALRNQAERIIRTVAPEELRAKKACYIEDHKTSCPPIHKKEQTENLCMACRLFGGNGWRSPIMISDFLPVPNGHGEECEQDFVAIDRYTGGAADRKKFKACYRFGPILKGRLRIDLSRVGPVHVGVLALALRDLLEGDMFMGFGRSKGLGACRGKITEINLPQHYPEWMKKFMSSSENWEQLAQTELPMNPLQTELLEHLVADFNEAVSIEA
ncbi:RAMP superfamily CRISPR-associated protein [Desulfonema magnum]|uniref:CRISPR type III-associated RAMP domain-containing protein n=1 Tax=Desulfonema magnum TaxID=45655 RepID=A0A975BQB4_9BACT|nr:RAMP superfamily CRISPR-associated protein [Desulfonema magnum]QTA89244.1 CRISPR type III-associated RAMP domain-containing protein [Desulfonema magnum]